MSEERQDLQSASAFFRAVLLPHRSLGRKGFLILMGFISALSFLTGLGFYLLGAWPVLGFFSLDMLLIYGAFRLNYRAARLYETVELTSQELRVTRVHPSGRAQSLGVQPLLGAAGAGGGRHDREPPQPALAWPRAAFRQLPQQ
jgi:uncharacterized membrane protein